MPTLQEITSNAGKGDYLITRLSKNNLGDLVTLYTAVYDLPSSTEHFQKKYDTSYTGFEDVGFIAYDKDIKPVAFYGVIPCFLEFKNELIPVAQSADTMTHPEHRSKGLFVRLSEMTFDLCHKMGIRLLFGFPNQNAYPVMINRLGWIETEKMSRFSIPVVSTLELTFFKGFGKKQERLLEEIITDREMPNSIIADGYAGVCRNEAYMLYKTFGNNHVIKIKAGNIWIKTRKELIIGDIFLKKGREKDFFPEIISLTKKMGLGRISFQVCNDCRLYHLFAQKYQPVSSFPVIFKDIGSGLPLEKIKFTFADIDIF